MNAAQRLHSAMDGLPLIAILRGLPPTDAAAVGEALIGAGWSILEVPLNSPSPLSSIATLASRWPQLLVGAGTVLCAAQVREVHAAGGRLIVSPHLDAGVVAAALALDMVCLSGVATPTEALSALHAGAHGLKLFPAEMITPAAVAALRAVLDPAVRLLPVGGINATNMAAYRRAGASGFGLGSALYRPGQDATGVATQATALAAAWRASGSP